MQKLDFKPLAQCHVKKQASLRKELEITRAHLLKVNQAYQDFQEFQKFKVDLEAKLQSKVPQ